MNYIPISNGDGTYLLVHADNEGAYLAHHGVKGQRWGVRRYQNYDGSLNPAGVKRMTTLKDKSDKFQKKKDKLNSPKQQIRQSKYRSLSSDYHTKANAAKADEDYYRDKSTYALTGFGARSAEKKATKAHKTYVTNAKKAAEYDSYMTKFNNANAKLDRKKLKIDTRWDELNAVYQQYGRSEADKKKK